MMRIGGGSVPEGRTTRRPPSASRALATTSAARTGTALPSFPWNETHRLHPRAGLDTLLFHLYSVTNRDDTHHIHSTFPTVECQETATHGHHRARNLSLARTNAPAAGDQIRRLKDDGKQPTYMVALRQFRYRQRMLYDTGMTQIQKTATLVYYDGVQVFEGRDSTGGHYIGVLIDFTDNADQYLVTGVSPEKLRLFRAGDLCLRTLLLDTSRDGWYFAYIGDDFEKPAPLEPQNGPLQNQDFLPDPGFTLHDESIADDTTIVKERK